MKSIDSLMLVALAGLSSISSVLAADFFEIGCYSSFGSARLNSTSRSVSFGTCRDQCFGFPLRDGITKDVYSVLFLQGTNCYCGNYKPNDAYKVADSECSYPCPGLDTDNCKLLLCYDGQYIYLTCLTRWKQRWIHLLCRGDWSRAFSKNGSGVVDVNVVQYF